MRNGWIVTRASGAERLRLLCFPFAGGSSQIFRTWPGDLPSDLGVHAVQLPGRGPRLAEPATDDMNRLMDSLVPALVPLLDRPYALFGHSMGAAVAFETARRLAARGHFAPVHLYVSARAAPGLPRRAPIDTLDDDAFIARLRAIGGTPEEVLAEPELLAMFLPMLRADFRLNDNYVPSPGPKLSCPVTAFGGRADPLVRADELEAWRDLTDGPFALTMIEGGHHYIPKAQRALLHEIARRLAPAVRA